MYPDLTYRKSIYMNLQLFYILLSFFLINSGPLTPYQIHACSLCKDVQISPPEDAGFAHGEISVQNDGPKEVFSIEGAAVVWEEGDLYTLTYLLDTGDSFELVFKRCRDDLNYHYPRACPENQILDVYFNDTPMNLWDAALSLQPKNQQAFTAVINLHTHRFGDWHGTVQEIPLVEAF